MSTGINNPYVGPRAFTEQEQDRFFGREREARGLLSVVIANRIVLFYAQSGAGKSSLLNVRLVPGLRQEHFIVLPMGRVSGGVSGHFDRIRNIFAFNLMLSLDQSRSDPSRFTDLTLADFFARLTTRDGRYYYYRDVSSASDQVKPASHTSPPHVLIIDQFEEIITTYPERWEDRLDFFRQLDELMTADPQLWLVLTLREDYVAALDPYAPLLPGKLQARFYMPRMEYPAALAAVKEPASQYGRPFAPGVAEILVNDLRQIKVQTPLTSPSTPILGQYIEPVQLQVVCYQLWEKLKERPAAEIMAADLQELGSIDAALAEFYEAALAKTTQQTGLAEIELRRWFEQELITEAGTRGSVYQGVEKTAGLPNEAVNVLADQFLLRAESRAGGVWIELVHDRFVEPIRQANQVWLAGRLQRNPLMRANQVWHEAGRRPEQLLTGAQLQEAQAYMESHPQDVTTEEAQFLQESRRWAEVMEAETREKEAQRQRELEQAQALAEAQQQRAEAEQQRAELQAQAARRLRRLIVGLVVALLAALAATYVALQQSTIATARQLTATSQVALSQGDIRLATLLAMEADKLKPGEGASLLSHIPYASPNSPITLHYTLPGRDRVTSVAWRPDGQRLASGSWDKTIIIWDAANGQALSMLTGYEDRITSVAWHPGGQRLAAGYEDGTIIIWDVTGEQILATLAGEQGHQNFVSSLAWHPDGQRLASGSHDDTIIIWDVTGEQVLATLAGEQGHQNFVSSVAWHPDGQRLASGSWDGTTIIWDVASSQVLTTLTGEQGHKGGIISVAWHPDGQRLASGSWDGTIIIWEVASGQALTTLTGHKDGVTSITWQPNGQRLASGSADKTIIIWELTSSPALTTLAGHRDEVKGVAWHPDGQRLASGSEDDTIIIWDAASGQALSALTGHEDGVTSVAWHPDGQRLASGYVNKAIIIWDAAKP